MKLGLLASHAGTNMQAIIDACKQGVLDAESAVVISNNAGSGALQRAFTEKIPAVHLSSITHPVPAALDAEMARVLSGHRVDLVVLAGYLKKIGPATIAAFPRRILNIHPALLPRFGGLGMYGARVHAAVLEAGDAVTGITVHLVDEEYDRGPVVAQCEVEVLEGDTVESLSQRVLHREHRFYIETLRRIASGELDLDRLG